MFEGFLSAANSTTTPLLAAATFTGQFEIVKDFGCVVVTTFSDVASAVDGLRVEWSTDGTNIDVVETYTLEAGVGRSISPTVKAQYVRVKFTNGGTNQTAFRMNTLYTYSSNNSNVGITGDIQIAMSDTGTRTSVAASASAVTLLAANVNRLGATIKNDSKAWLYVALGSAASVTDYTERLKAGGYYEVPSYYTGIITGIWSEAIGNARITELT